MGRMLRVAGLMLCGMVVAAGAACQYQPISALKLQVHQSLLGHDGLAPVQAENDLQVTISAPANWRRLSPNHTLLYTHQQWRSPSRHAGVGVVHIHSLVPLSADTLVFLAKAHYENMGKNTGPGKVLSQWTDNLQRLWFEVEDDKYHIRGYAMTRGLDAWIVYGGWLVKTPASEQEKALAALAAESVAPLTAK